MFDCNMCHNPCQRRLRFEPCNHSICDTCVGNLIWSGNDGHFLCCLGPYCKMCNDASDIVAETFGGSSKTIIEMKDDTYAAKNKK